jgi:hypothetical protein
MHTSLAQNVQPGSPQIRKKIRCNRDAKGIQCIPDANAPSSPSDKSRSSKGLRILTGSLGSGSLPAPRLGNLGSLRFS